jgi:hypothetical protein
MCPPEPGALAEALGGVERLEDAGEHVGWHALAGVAYFHRHVVAGLDVGVLRRIVLIKMGVPGGERQPAAARHRVAGIVGKIGDGGLELCAVGHDRRDR